MRRASKRPSSFVSASSSLSPSNGSLPTTVSTSPRRRWRRHKRYAILAGGLLVACLLMVVLLTLYLPSPFSKPSNQHWATISATDVSLVFGHALPPMDTFFSSLPTLKESDVDRGHAPNYNGLKIRWLPSGQARVIYKDRVLNMGKWRPKHADDTMDYYYAFDDDQIRNPYRYEQEHVGQQCRRTSWYRHLPINCAAFHELDVATVAQQGHIRYVGSGAYRDAYLLDVQGQGEFIFKTFRYDGHFRYNSYESMRKDSLVAERLSAFTDRIVGIYGFCALVHLGQAMPNGDLHYVALPETQGRYEVELNDKDGVDPKNDLLPSQKLQLALEMAEPLVLMHAHAGGVMVHGDIQLSQYLFTPDGHLKLNDFNRAEFPLWNERDQEYCGYRNGRGNGDWRAPQEYFDDLLDEKLDVWSYCNNVYSVLTGLVPYYDALQTEDVKARVKKGDMPYVDPRWNRSFAEGKLAELLPKCYAYEPNDRISMFEIVKYLRAAVEENNRSHRQEDEKFKRQTTKAQSSGRRTMSPVN